MIGSPIIQALFAAVIGWLSGGLVNYLSDSLPHRTLFSLPKCAKCNSILPFLTYYYYFRRCNHCGATRNIRIRITMVIYIIASLWIWFSPPDRLGYTLGLVLIIYFGVVTIIDIEHHLILHPISAFGALLGLGIGVYLHGIIPTLLGGLAGFGLMLILYYLGFVFVKIISRLRKQQINEVALGFGDVNLSGVLGLILGWPGIIAGLIFAIIIGGIISLIYMIVMALQKQYRADTALPYGPFLIASAILLIFFNDLLM